MFNTLLVIQKMEDMAEKNPEAFVKAITLTIIVIFVSVIITLKFAKNDNISDDDRNKGIKISIIALICTVVVGWFIAPSLIALDEKQTNQRKEEYGNMWDNAKVVIIE